MTSRFDDKAATWDENPKRIQLVEKVFTIVDKNLSVSNQSTVLDFGCGTGLLGMKLVDSVKELVFCDASEGMLEQVKKKLAYYKIENAKVLQSDFSEEVIQVSNMDVITSMLVIHHVEDVSALLTKFGQVLNTGGQLCWIDLDTEDGTFHDDNTGVVHFGFSKNYLEKELNDAGFTISFYSNEVMMNRETENGIREFPLFVCIATKN